MVAGLRISESDNSKGVAFIPLELREIDCGREQTCRRDAGELEPQCFRGTFRLMDVEEPWQLLVVDGNGVATRLGDKEHRAVVNGEAVAPLCVRLRDLPTVRDENTFNSYLAGVVLLIAVGIVENCSCRGTCVATFGYNLGGSYLKLCVAERQRHHEYQKAPQAVRLSLVQRCYLLLRSAGRERCGLKGSSRFLTSVGRLDAFLAILGQLRLQPKGRHS